MGKRAQRKREEKQQAEKSRKDLVRYLEREKDPWLNFWRRPSFWIFTVCLLLIFAFPFIRKDALVMGDQAVIHTSKGDIEIEFYKESAPKTVENFQLLSQRGYYNDLTWHRVIKGFMIQGGDPGGDGTGGESAWGEPFEDEISAKSLGLDDAAIKQLTDKGYVYNDSLTSHKMVKGSVAMANSGPNTNGSQFFIVTDSEQPHLDGQHTVFAEVTGGMDVVKAISEVEVDENDKPKSEVKILSVELK